jgi:hypothetical protein
MKEFKFRAWDKKNKKMIYPPSPCDSSLGPYAVTFDGRTYIDGVYQDLEYLPWTGLIDKDAEYIYEGDIFGGFYDRGYIIYCEKCKGFQYHYGELDDNQCFACDGEIHWAELIEFNGTFEIMGNIYENPECLREL